MTRFCFRSVAFTAMLLTASLLPARALQVELLNLEPAETKPGSPAAVTFKITNNAKFRSLFVPVFEVENPERKTIYRSLQDIDGGKRSYKVEAGKSVNVVFKVNLPKTAIEGEYFGRLSLRNPYSKNHFFKFNKGSSFPAFHVPAPEIEELKPSAAPVKFKPKTITPSQGIVMTGMRGEEKKVVEFKPKTITSAQGIVMTGMRGEEKKAVEFKPKTITPSQGIVMTGMRGEEKKVVEFKPKTITSAQGIVMTGTRVDPPTKKSSSKETSSRADTSAAGPSTEKPDKPAASASIQAVPDKMIINTNNTLTGDFSSQSIILKGKFMVGDAVTFNFTEAKNNPWKFKVGESFDITWTPSQYPFSMKLAGKVALTRDGASIAFTSGKATFTDEQSLNLYEVAAFVEGPKGARAPFTIVVTPGEEVEAE